jgi:hypothetical protein
VWTIALGDLLKISTDAPFDLPPHVPAVMIGA